MSGSVKLSKKDRRKLAKAKRAELYKAGNAAVLSKIAELRSAKMASKKKRRKIRRLMGKGKYDMGEGIAGLVPRGLGWLGAKAFGYDPEEGWNMGGKLSRLMGMGAYGVPWQATAGGMSTSSPVPLVGNAPDEGVLMHREEFMAMVESTTDYAVTKYPLNPGMASTFRWASGIARNFQNYRIRQLVVRFESQLTNAVAAFESMGVVMLCAKTNAAAPAPGSQIEFEQTEFATSVKPNQSVTAPIEMNPAEGAGGVKMVRFDDDIGVSVSINDYDSGNLFIATTGMPSAGVAIGRLYLEYTIEFYNPVLVTSGDAWAQYKLTGITSSSAYGSDPPTKVYDNLGTGITFTTGLGLTAGPYNGWRVPAGNGGTYEVIMDVSGTAGSGTLTGPTFALTNCTQDGFYYYPVISGQYAYTFGGPNATKGLYITAFRVVDPTMPWGVDVSVGWANPPTQTVGEIIIRKIPTSNSGLYNARTPFRQVGVTREEVLELIRSTFDEQNCIRVDDSVSCASAASAASGRSTLRRP